MRRYICRDRASEWEREKKVRGDGEERSATNIPQVKWASEKDRSEERLKRANTKGIEKLKERERVRENDLHQAKQIKHSHSRAHTLKKQNDWPLVDGVLFPSTLTLIHVQLPEKCVFFLLVKYTRLDRLNRLFNTHPAEWNGMECMYNENTVLLLIVYILRKTSDKWRHTFRWQIISA